MIKTIIKEFKKKISIKHKSSTKRNDDPYKQKIQQMKIIELRVRMEIKEL